MSPAPLPDFIDFQTAIAHHPVVVAPTTTVGDAIARMGAQQTSYVLVIADDDATHLLGILTAGDIVRLRTQELTNHPRTDLDSAPIHTVMSQPVVTVNLADLSHWRTTLVLFQQARVRHLPVLDDRNRVFGVLTQDAVIEQLMPLLLKPSPVLRNAAPGEELALSQLNQELQLTLEELQVAEEGLRAQNLQLESERLKYEDLFKFAPEGYLVTDSLGVIQSANQAIAEMLGVNASFLMDKPLVLFVIPADRPNLYSQLNQRLLHDRKQTWEITLQPRQGPPLPVEVSVVPIANPTNSLMDLRWLVRNIRDRKQSEVLLANQNAILESIAKAESLPVILDSLLRTLELQLPNSRSSIMVLDAHGRLQSRATRHLPKAYLDAIEGVEVGEGVGSCGTAAFRRETVIVSDIANDPLWQNFKELALVHGLRSCWSVPILDKDGQVLGTFAAYHDTCHTPTSQDLAVAIRAANIAGIALERDQLVQALRQLNQDLEQRVAERTAALQASEERWQRVLQGSNDGIWDWDVITDRVFFSSRWKMMRGFAEDEIGDQRSAWWEGIHPEDYDRVFAAVGNHFNGATEFFEEEYRVRRKDGTYFWIFDRGQALRDASGRVIRMSGSETDITLRKQAELENQRLKERLQFVLSSSPAVIFTCKADDDYETTFMSDNIYAMTGYSAAEFMDEPSLWADRLHPEDAPQVFLNLAQVVEREHHVHEYRFRHQDGHYLWLQDGLRLVRDAQGHPLEFVGYCVDVSDRKQTEAALQLSEALFRNAFDTTAVGTALMTTEGRYIQVNAAFCVFLDYGEPELLELTFQQVSHPDDLETDLELTQQVLAGTRQSYHIEKRYVTRQGQIVWGLLSLSLIRDSQEQPLYFVAQIQDISDRKEYEQRLEQTNAELLRATRLKDEFLANMSHELRTPLNAILGMTQGLQEAIFGTSNDQQLKAYRIIESSGNHLLSLINDILDIAKIEAGQINLEFAQTSISHLCQSSLVFVRQQALRKNVQIELRQPATLPDLWADERRIRQVLINLLNNAVKFTPAEGSIILEISSQLSHDRSNAGHWIQFSVTDTGIGIAPEDIAKLFQPFIQIDSALNRKYTGTGLGLALVKHLVELHGGRVDVISELGQGSCFMFWLPGTAPLAKELSTEETTQSESSVDSGQRTELPPLVLLTEDHDATIITVSSYLRAKGYRILVAKHGQAAIDLATAHRPDIILMDIQMPGIDGLTATRQIRQTPDLAHIPIVALTALAMDEDRDRCMAAGATLYLTKPIQLQHLTNMIEQCLKI